MSRARQTNLEAADWLIARQDGPLSPGEQSRFETWMAESDGNKAAYWRLEYGWEQADRIGALGPDTVDSEEELRPARWSRWWVPMAIAASIALVVGSWQFATQRASMTIGKPVPDTSAQSFTTPVGGKRLVGLEDGSRMQLNTQSKVRTAFTAARRQVWLDQGEAFFEVAHRKDQPFIVYAGDRQITVLGTKFSVWRDGGKVVVSVLEGRVRVDEMKDNRLMRSSIIVGGDIAMAEGAATLVTARSEDKVESALSWRTGMLTFDEKPLPAIAAEFNRYNERKLVLVGPSVAAIRITGTFPSDKPDAFARLLRDAYGIAIDERETEIRVSR
ncbi:FecR family protein [Sphingobium lignivorans]|uniref:Transmembrane sensor n=1 Tax=Sphingobium lignivorans TaxID=2735886 RepID=A0ABR6NJS6_9SPHN|nr:FecR domain-containing protein [Sphingobium lignivorans]MBB5986738.1 transmembrane sensor [Sphingobium lignivorans]